MFFCDKIYIKDKEEIPEAVIRAAYASVANTAIFQLQDVLGLDNSARMNTPSTTGTNWMWRAKKGAFDAKLVKKLGFYTTLYGRDKNAE